MQNNFYNILRAETDKIGIFINNKENHSGMTKQMFIREKNQWEVCLSYK